MRDFFSVDFGRGEMAAVANPAHRAFTPRVRYSRSPKRIADVLFSLAVLPVLAPIIAILALIVRRDGGPAFFGHERVGRNGQTFKCWKIRTMVVDAEERLNKILSEDPEARELWDRERKLENDPRVTRLGRFLRKTSLDELPQFWNVLRGDMSVVGPRPVPRDELEQNYGHFKRVYQGMRPGVTGLWQVSGRNDITYGERVQMDLSYFKSMSFGLDTSIVLKTTAAVLNRTGK